MRSPLLAAVLLALPSLALAQGSLTPPGAPAPTMRTLEQIEPRTPLQAGAPGVTVNANSGFTITAPGSYYLTGNLTVASGDAIFINSGNVTLDLTGFTLSSTDPAPLGCGININTGSSRITIRNGHIRGTTTISGGVATRGGFTDGIRAYWETALQVEDVTVQQVASYGIRYAHRIVRCVARTCRYRGLDADEVLDSRAEDCLEEAIHATTRAVNCYGSSVGTATSGIGVSCIGTATNCIGLGNAGTGLSAGTALGSTGVSATGVGLHAFASATNCVGTTATGAYGLEVGDSGIPKDGGIAENCRGEITDSSGVESAGLFAGTATNCIGRNVTGIGLHATRAALNCHGITVVGYAGLMVLHNLGSPDPGSAENCRGDVTGEPTVSTFGLIAATATNCIGTSRTGYGLHAAWSAKGCLGTTDTGPFGLHCEATAEGSVGTVESGGGTGLFAGASATACRGFTSGSGFGLETPTAVNCTARSTTNTALQATINAENCRGVASGAGYGVYCAGNALNCYGSTSSGAYGIYVSGTANTCRGKNAGAGAVDFSLHAGLAVACTSEKGAIEATNRYLMPASP